MNGFNYLLKKIRILSPTQTIITSFLALIFMGALILCLPCMVQNRPGLNLIEAFFTATAAVCVTGLELVSTSQEFTWFGQLIIILLVQIGGLGFMTLTSLIFRLFHRRFGLRDRLLLAEQMQQDHLQDAVSLMRSVSLITLISEGSGAFLLALRFVPQYGLLRGSWYSIFHSISAFCSAGYTCFDLNILTNHNGLQDPYVMIILAILVIIGGLGFPIIVDLNQKRKFSKLSLHSRMVLLTTGVLIAFGSMSFLFSEFNNPSSLQNYTWPMRILLSLFHGVSPRSAGFSIVDYRSLKPVTLLITCILMFIGAAPASTGGGIKVTTFATIILFLIGSIKGSREAIFMKRRLAFDVVQKSLVICSIAFIQVIFTTAVLLVLEPYPLEDMLFEAVSACSTAGISLGITKLLSTPSQVVLMVMMFVGRVGPLSIAMAVGHQRPRPYEFAEGRVIVG